MGLVSCQAAGGRGLLPATGTAHLTIVVSTLAPGRESLCLAAVPGGRASAASARLPDGGPASGCCSRGPPYPHCHHSLLRCECSR